MITVTPSYQGDLSLVGVRSIDGLLVGRAGEILGKAFETGESQGMRIGVRCEAGEPAEEIAGFAAGGRFDLVVLGAGRKSPIARWLRGNPRSGIIRRLDEVEVLVIPEQAVVGWEKVLLVASGPEAGPGIFSRATELARSYGGSLEVHRLVAATKRKAGAGGMLSGGLPETMAGNAAEIMQRIRRGKFDMILLGRDGCRGRWPFRTGLMEKIVDQGLPVLVLKEAYEAAKATSQAVSPGAHSRNPPHQEFTAGSASICARGTPDRFPESRRPWFCCRSPGAAPIRYIPFRSLPGSGIPGSGA